MGVKRSTLVLEMGWKSVRYPMLTVMTLHNIPNFAQHCISGVVRNCC